MSTEQLFTYDVCPSPLLYNNDRTMTKPEKYELLTELEMGLDKSDREMGEVDAQIVDVMGVVRKLRTTNFKTFGDLAIEFYRLTECYVFDLYITTSAKDSERLRSTWKHYSSSYPTYIHKLQHSISEGAIQILAFNWE